MPMSTELRDIPTTLRRLSVDEVIRMAEAGILGETERLELVDGRLVEMSPEGADHANAVATLTTRLARLYPEGFQVRSQSTLPLGEHSYLEPDVFVIRPRDDGWRWPTVDEVVLVVEVARTSARRDRTEKARLYAAWGARIYWVVDLTRRALVLHSGPGPDGYSRVTTVTDGELELPGIEAATPVAEFLPPR